MRREMRFGLIIMALLVLGSALWHADELQATTRRALVAAAESGGLSPLWYAMMYVAAAVLMLPVFPLKLGAGFLFGFKAGAVISVAAGTLASTAAFLVGRFLARGWVQRQLEPHPTWRRIDVAVGQRSWRIVFLARLSILLPGNLLNYAFGVSRVSLGSYVSATALGIIPISVANAWLGSTAQNLSAVFEAGRSDPLRSAMYALGASATILIVIYLAAVARQALDMELPRADELTS